MAKGEDEFAAMILTQYYARDIEHPHQQILRERIEQKKGQDPHILCVPCDDSFTVTMDHLGKASQTPDHIFDGSRIANPLMARIPDIETGKIVTDGTEDTSYFMNHLVKNNGFYVVNPEGHTDCGGLHAVLGGFENESPSIKWHLHSIQHFLDPDYLSHLKKMYADDKLRANALLAQHNLDSQVDEFMAHYDVKKSRANIVVVATMKDLTGRFLAPENFRLGDEHIVGIDGLTKPDDIKNHPFLQNMQKKYSFGDEVLDYTVRRLEY